MHLAALGLLLGQLGLQQPCGKGAGGQRGGRGRRAEGASTVPAPAPAHPETPSSSHWWDWCTGRDPGAVRAPQAAPMCPGPASSHHLQPPHTFLGFTGLLFPELSLLLRLHAALTSHPSSTSWHSARTRCVSAPRLPLLSSPKRPHSLADVLQSPAGSPAPSPAPAVSLPVQMKPGKPP